MARLKRLPGTDRRYPLISVMHSEGRIKTFRDIFTYIPKTIVAEDLGINAGRFNEMIAEPGLLQVNKIKRIAQFFGMDVMQVMGLVLTKASV